MKTARSPSDSQADSSTAARSGPSPTTSSTASSTLATASTASCTRFSGEIDPTHPTTRPSAGRPNARRDAALCAWSAGSKSFAERAFGMTSMRSAGTPY